MEVTCTPSAWGLALFGWPALLSRWLHVIEGGIKFGIGIWSPPITFGGGRDCLGDKRVQNRPRRSGLNNEWMLLMKSKPLRIAATLVAAASLVVLILVLITGRFELIYAPALPLILCLVLLFMRTKDPQSNR